MVPFTLLRLQIKTKCMKGKGDNLSSNHNMFAKLNINKFSASYFLFYWGTYLFNMVNYGNLSGPRIKIGIFFKLTKRSNQHLHAHDK